VIETQGGSQPICALWPTRLAGALRVALASGVRKVEEFAQAYQPARVDWPEEYFLNINRPEDLERAEQLLPTMN